MPFSFSLKLIRTKTNADGRNKWLDSGSMLHHQHASTLSSDMKNNEFTFTIPLTRFSISKTICFLLGFFCNRVEILKKFLFASSSFSHPPNSSLSISLRFHSIYIQSISCAGVLTQLLSPDAISHCCLADVYISCATFLYSFSFNYKHSGICCALFKIFCLSEKESWHVSQQYLHHSLPVMSTEIEKLCSRVSFSRCQLFHHVIMAANKRRSGPREATFLCKSVGRKSFGCCFIQVIFNFEMNYMPLA